MSHASKGVLQNHYFEVGTMLGSELNTTQRKPLHTNKRAMPNKSFTTQ